MADDVFTTDDQISKPNDAGVLEALVGPGKKFESVEALAKGKQEADDFIEQLKLEKAQLSEGLSAKESEENKQATIAELIKTVKEANESSTGGDNQPMTPEQLQELVRSVMKDEKTADKAVSNRERGNKLVLDKMEGDVEAAKAYVADRAQKLGMTPAQLAELSESSPDAFSELMDVKPNATQPNVSGLPNLNSQATDQGEVLQVDGTPTKAHFDKLKKEMGLAKYVNDTKLQLQYLRASQKLGERFK